MFLLVTQLSCHDCLSTNIWGFLLHSNIWYLVHEPLCVSYFINFSFFRYSCTYYLVYQLDPFIREFNQISPDNAHNYVFTDGATSAGIGVERFADMLVATGAQKQHASKE